MWISGGDGSLDFIMGWSDWPTTKVNLAADVTGDGIDDIMRMDMATNVLEIFKSDGAGNLLRLRDHDDLAAFFLFPCHLDWDSISDLFVYDNLTGDALLLRSDGLGDFEVLGQYSFDADLVVYADNFLGQ